MILAGDIGGTNARLSFYREDAKKDRDNGNSGGGFSAIREQVFKSREFRGLDEIVLKFISETGIHPDIASFGIAGPVRNGRVETSNLPWVVESSRLAQELRLDSVSLIRSRSPSLGYPMSRPDRHSRAESKSQPSLAPRQSSGDCRRYGPRRGGSYLGWRAPAHFRL